MGRKARVDRTPEQKWEIVLEGLKSGNIAETYRRRSARLLHPRAPGDEGRSHGGAMSEACRLSHGESQETQGRPSPSSTSEAEGLGYTTGQPTL